MFFINLNHFNVLYEINKKSVKNSQNKFECKYVKNDIDNINKIN